MNWGRVQAWLNVGASVVIIATGLSVLVTGLTGWLLKAAPQPWLLIVLVGTFLAVFGGLIAAWRRLAPVNHPIDHTTVGTVMPRSNFDPMREWRLSQVRENALQMELNEWGNDRAARKYLKRVLDEHPDLLVREAKELAQLLYYVYQFPHTPVPLPLVEADGELLSAVSLEPLLHSKISGHGQAILLKNHLEQMVTDAKNDSNRDARQPPS